MDFFKQVNLSECHARVMGLSPAKRGISLQTSLEIVFDVVIGFGGDELTKDIHRISQHIAGWCAVEVSLKAPSFRVGRACGDACQFECPGIDECRDAICPRHEQRFVPGECVYVELVEKALLVGPLPFDPSAALHPVSFGNGLCPVLDGCHCFCQRRNTEQAEGFCPATDTFQMLVGISEAGEYCPPGQIENLRIAAQVGLDAGFIADIYNAVPKHCQSAGSPLVVVGGINRGVVNYQISSLTDFACVLRCQVRLNARGLIAAGRRKQADGKSERGRSKPV